MASIIRRLDAHKKKAVIGELKKVQLLWFNPNIFRGTGNLFLNLELEQFILNKNKSVCFQ